ncbi:MAG: hypothetical protein RLZZ490_241 [Cyanobacteriota bacterium]
MQEGWGNFGQCQLRDRRSVSRAENIGRTINQNFGKGLSNMFASGNELKRTYEFSAILKPVLRKSLLPIA